MAPSQYLSLWHALQPATAAIFLRVLQAPPSPPRSHKWRARFKQGDPVHLLPHARVARNILKMALIFARRLCCADLNLLLLCSAHWYIQSQKYVIFLLQ